ncbi:hypothetical protein EON81_30190 [bacterium]|nr:MAG: hypothetical protein EON81_30190 [bacterium]
MTYALFSASESAHRAVEALRSHGVRDEALSIVDASQLDGTHDDTGRGGAPSTDPTHATPITGDLQGGRAPDSPQREGANKTQLAAGGLGLAAIGTGLLVPGLGIVLGAGALAAALAGVLTKNSGAPESANGLSSYLRSQNLSEDTVDIIGSQLDSGGSLVQIDPVNAGLPEAQILQVVSEYGGRVAWNLGDTLTHTPTASHP